MTRILIIDDHSIIRQGIRSLLSNHAEFDVVAEAANAADALALARTHQPDITLLDIRMPDSNGLDLVMPIQQAAPETRILILSSFDDDEYISQAMRLGVHGFINKSASDETLVSAIQAAQRGERVFSPSVLNRVVEQFAALSKVQILRDLSLDDGELRLIQMLVAGASNSDMAHETFTSEATVKRKLQEIFRKLGVSSRAQAAAEAVKRQLV